MPDVSFPPASPSSGRPPPEPPRSLASSWTIFPAWSLGIRSLLTAVIRATFPSSADARTTTPEPNFWRRASTNWRIASQGLELLFQLLAGFKLAFERGDDFVFACIQHSRDGA